MSPVLKESLEWFCQNHEPGSSKLVGISNSVYEFKNAAHRSSCARQIVDRALQRLNDEFLHTLDQADQDHVRALTTTMQQMTIMIDAEYMTLIGQSILDLFASGMVLAMCNDGYRCAVGFLLLRLICLEACVVF